MFEVALKVTPVVMLFALGFILKKMHLLKKEDGDLFLKVVFYVALPAFILLSITKSNLSLDFIYLPISAVLIIISTFVVSFFAGKALRLPQTTFGVFLIGSMIMNVGFILPFVVAVHGEEGLTRLSLFDFGNGFLVFTFVYYFACKYGNGAKNSRSMVKKFILSPPIWALLIALLLNINCMRLPEFIDTFLQSVGAMTNPLIMLALGVYFSPKIVQLIPLSSVVLIRMICGLLLGFFFTMIFDLDGLSRVVVLLGSSAPVGYNTLTFSSLENLDKEFAASLVSVSIGLGIVFLPALIFILG